MGLFDKLRRSDTSPSGSQSEVATPDLSSSPGSSGASASSAGSVPGTDLLDSATITSTSEFTGAPGVSGRFYNPYEGLNQSLEGRGSRTPYRLPQQPEFLFSEESTVHRRSWSENLTFYTGVGYLTGGSWFGSQPPLPHPLGISWADAAATLAGIRTGKHNAQQSPASRACYVPCSHDHACLAGSASSMQPA